MSCLETLAQHIEKSLMKSSTKNSEMYMDHYKKFTVKHQHQNVSDLYVVK